jgi:DNA-binding NarL/FixJ family response regulator
MRLTGASAPARWAEAIGIARQAGNVHALMYGLTRLAEALVTDGDRDAAAAAVREAIAMAEGLGARPLLDDALALARRARLTDEEEVAADGDSYGLTSREREVLRLVADGRSNGQIAEALFISPKTASVHVSNILGKLGASTRVEAAAIAHRTGLAV